MRRSLMVAVVLGTSLLALAPASIATAAPANSDSRTTVTRDPRPELRTFEGRGRTRYEALDRARDEMRREERRRDLRCREERQEVRPDRDRDSFNATIWALCERRR
jgi:hypothetical protein